MLLVCLLLFGCLLFAVPFASAAITCKVKGSACSGAQLDLGGMSSLTDGHYEQYNQSAYTFRICCTFPAATAKTNLCGVSDSTSIFIQSSSYTDAHVELNNESTAGYDGECIGLNSSGATVTYQNDGGVCSGQDTCMFTISSTKDAHVANCTQPGKNYTIAVCLKERGVAVPEFSTIGLIVAVSILTASFVAFRRK